MSGLLWLVAAGIALFGIGFAIGRLHRAEELDAAWMRGVSDGRRAAMKRWSP